MRFYFKIFLVLTIFNLLEKIQFALMHNLFTDLTFIQSLYSFLFGLRIDIAVASLFTFCIYIAYYLRLRFTKLKLENWTIPVCLFFGIVLSMIHIGDTIYYFDSSRHLGYEGLELFIEPKVLIQVGLVNYWDVLFINLPILFAFYLAVKFILKTDSHPMD